MSSAFTAAADLIPAHSNVLCLGPAEGLAAALPLGCELKTGDLDTRFSNGATADLVVGDGAPAELLRRIRELALPVVGTGGDAELRARLGEAGFQLQHVLGEVFKATPAPAAAPSRPKKVLVLSYLNTPNFGDRLGFHVMNGLIPADAEVTHATVQPWTAPDERFDLFILGIGGSLNSPTVARHDLQHLVETTPTIGVFGTHYRRQYAERFDPRFMDQLLGGLVTWWARYEEDVLAFGRGRDNVRHLGDFLISAFPMSRPTDRRTLNVPADVKDRLVSLDRLIQEIQSFRRVSSARVHPLLCALTSAEEVAYREQQEDADNRSSGKFRSQLYDIFGRTFPEDEFFPVDRDAVVRYKARVEANMEELKAQIRQLLA